MKMKQILVLAVALYFLFTGVDAASAQGTAFTYQGQLQDQGSVANGTYDLKLRLYDAITGGSLTGGPITNAAIAVSNGLFTTAFEFSNVFDGASLWLDIGARTNGATIFTFLSPRQQLTPVPYAIFASTSSNLSGTVNAAQLSGMVGNLQLSNSSITVTAGTGLGGGGAVALGGSTTLNNAGVLSVSGNADITASTAGGAVTLGDTATHADTASTIVKRDGSGNFAAASIALDGNLNLPATSASAGIIYSGTGTLIHAYGSQSFFAGLGAGNLTQTANANTGVGFEALLSASNGGNNTASGAYALYFNTSGSNNTAIGAQALQLNTNGNFNTASGAAALQFNTSGLYNTADGYNALLDNTTGSYNTANGVQVLKNNTSGSYNTGNGVNALFSNTSGNGNTANGYTALYNNASGSYNTVNGDAVMINNMTGSNNTANVYAALYYDTNGSYNTAEGMQALNYNTSGNNNIALGYQAGFNITSNDNIDIGALGDHLDTGIIRLGDPSVQTTTYLAGNVYATSFNPTSDRNAKENFQPVDNRAVLAKVVALPVTQWNFKKESTEVQHIGPMAQDFQAAFQLSADDKHISVVDEGGVALAAIQGLNQKLNEKDAEIQKLKEKAAKVDLLEKRLTELEQVVQLLAQKK